MGTSRDSTRLGVVLDQLYSAFNYPGSAPDPISLVRRYPRPDDREVVGFCAAVLAFGRVSSVLHSIERVLAVMGKRPARYVRRFDPGRDGPDFDGFVHRWIKGRDIVALMLILQQMITGAGTIEAFFLEALGGEHSEDVGPALERFSTRARALDVGAADGRDRQASRVEYFFPRPSGGSACKRLNLFLRWMVRRDELDLGVWSGVAPAMLVVPLDTHVIRVGRCLGLTSYRSPGWRMASDITRSLRAVDPEDPVKYDFSLCHLGMMNACGFDRPARDTQCPLRGLCQPHPHTPRPLRKASAGG